jgi:hypothetical protein
LALVAVLLASIAVMATIRTRRGIALTVLLVIVAASRRLVRPGRQDPLGPAPVPFKLLRCRATLVRPEHAVALLRLLGGGAAGDLVGLPRS